MVNSGKDDAQDNSQRNSNKKHEEYLDVKKKRVVTAFLKKKDKVLVLRRSDNVKTYPGRWGGISGYLEGDEPLERAKKEIEEETSLQTKLISKGKPLLVRDKGTNWEVYPFLFEASGDIQLNWENSEYRWIEPNKLKSLNAVPKLWKAYKSVSDKNES